jgi:hypothetical protein
MYRTAAAVEAAISAVGEIEQPIHQKAREVVALPQKTG